MNEPIEPDKPASEIRQEPYSLPAGFIWDTLMLDNTQTVCSFLKIFHKVELPH